MSFTTESEYAPCVTVMYKNPYAESDDPETSCCAAKYKAVTMCVAGGGGC